MRLVFSLILLILATPVQANTRDGLIGWWTFDEASGNALDSSWNGTTGTPTGTTIIPNCPRGGCRQFNGSTDLVDLGINTLGGGTTFSVSTWVKITATPTAYTQIVTSWDGGGTDIAWGTGMYWNDTTINGAQSFYFQLYGGVSNKKVFMTPASSVSLNAWNHLVAVRTGDTTAALYINGVSQSLSTAYNTSPGVLSPTSNNLRIGKYSFGLTGSIDDVRIYNRALTAQEVKDLYNLGAAFNY